MSDYFLPWYQIHPVLKGKTAKDAPISQSTLWFFTEFKIVWIWKWDLQIGTDQLKLPILQRTFWFIWWDKFEVQPTIEVMKTTMNKYQTSIQKETQKTAGSMIDSGGNLFSFLLDSVKFKYPNLSSAEQNVKVMELLKEQFLASQLYEPPTEGHVYPAGESQDPYEDDDMSIVSTRSNEGVAEDFFDALIQI